MQRAIKWAVGLFCSIAFLCGGFIILHGSLPPASINAWLPAGNLTAARSGAASVFLQDGRLLITGGNGAAGALATTEILDPSSGFTAGPPMNLARSNHVAVLLQDGRVLVAGGTDASGRASQSAELFDPAANSWSASGPLMVGRTGATATPLPSGEVLIAGGTANGAALVSLEVFDPTSNTFSLAAGVLSSPRENHAAALLPDGRVLIAGGWDGTSLAPAPPATAGAANVLASTDIFEPSTGAVAPGPVLTSPRMNFTATTALDGSVIAIGGTDGQNDLASIDVLTPGAGAFALSGATLTTARQGHLAFLLPHNGTILIIGGSSGGAAISSVELYTPWTGATSVTGAMGLARSGATGSPLFQTVLGAPVGIDGALLVAGGLDASSPPSTLQNAEVYGFATITTDKSDYPPGVPVTITGSGWQPGEVVQMSLVEVPDLDGDSPIALTATADANGNITNTSFSTNIEDANIHFTLTAVGSVSQAQTTFTDTVNFSLGVAVLGAQSPNPVLAGNSATFGTSAANSVAVTFTPGGSGSVNACTAGLTVSAGLPSGASASFSPATLTTSGSSTQTLHSLMTISTVSTTPAGTYTLTVKATKNVNCTGSEPTTTVSLVVVAPQLVFTNAPLNTLAAQCSAVTVQRQDSNGTPTSSGSQLVNLVTSSGAGAFFGDSSCGTTTPSTTITNGNSTSTVYYKDNADGTPTLTASASGFTSGTQNETINLQLAFTSAPFTANTGQCSPLITLQSQNFAGALTAPSANRILSLSSSSAGGTFYSNSTCITMITTTNLTHNGAGAGTASFYYKDTTAGAPMISVSGALLVSTMQTETVNAANVATTLTLDAPSPASVSLGSSGPVTFAAHLKRNDTNAAVSGATINFSVDGTDVGTTATTDGTGTATLSTYNPSALAAGSHNIQASFTAATISSTSYTASTSGTQTLTVTAPTTLTLSAPSPASVSLGSAGPVTLSATLTRASGETPVSGATITFKVDGSSVGSAVTNGSGVATLSTYDPSALSAGSHNVQASFAQATISSITYESSDSATQTLTISVPTTLTLSAPSPASVSYGSMGPVSLSATLTQTSGGAPISGATITFKVDGTSVGTPTTNGSGVATVSYDPSSLSVGDHTIQAFFAGQTISSISYDASTSNQETLTITVATTLTLDVPSPASVSLGTAGPVTFTAHLKRNDTNAAVSGATVTFKVDGSSVGTGTTDGTGAAILSYDPSSLAAGSHTVQAFFAGQAISSITYEASTSTQQTLNITVPTTLVLAAPSPASVSWGTHGPVSLSATLTRNDTSGAVGGATITFKVDGTSVGTPTTNGSGVATFSYDPSGLAAGDHTIQAFFAGQAISSITFEASTSGTQTLTITVPTTLVLAAPSPASISVGSTGPVTFSATLTRNDTSAALAAQTVEFKVDGNSAGTGTTNGSGVATLPYNPSALTPGIHNVTASYAGATVAGIIFESSNSGTQTLNITVPTTLVLNSVTPNTVVWGTSGPVAFSATLTRNDTSGPVAGATVSFTVDGVGVGSAMTNASGVATLSTYNPSSLSAGTHNVQASFGPQAISGITFENSTSGTLTLTVTVPTTLTLAPPNPSSVVLGSPAPVTFSATLTRNDTTGPVAGATVSFTVDGNPAGSGITNASGVATVTTYDPSALIIGGHNVQASFAGATLGGIIFLSSTSGMQTLSVMFASGGMCDGDLGHSILQPINFDGSSVFKQKSTVPAKFRVCNFFGNSVGPTSAFPNVVSAFNIVQIVSGTVTSTVNETVDSTTPDTMFRWSSADQQWIFNTNTKGLSANTTYYFRITLVDGSTINYWFGLK